MTRLTGWVLRLYPRAIRNRYGEEITDLLAHSTTPARDLANVIGTALLDRTEHTMHTINPGRWTMRLAIGLTIPLALVAAGRSVHAGLLTALQANHQMTLYVRAPVMMLATAALVVAALAAGRLTARHTGPPTGTPIATAACALVLLAGVMNWSTASAGSPYTGWLITAVAAWTVGTWALAARTTTLQRAGRRHAAATLAIIGGIVLIDAVVAVVAGGIIGLHTGWKPFTSAYPFAPLWYPTLLAEGMIYTTGDGRFGLDLIQGDNPLGSFGPLPDLTLSTLPLAMSICTTYILAQATARPSRQPTTAPTIATAEA